MKPAAQSLHDVIALSLSQGLGIKSSAAQILAETILRNAAELGLGGADYYLPACHPATRAERDARIRHEFNGQNLAHICRKYGVSRTTVYRVVRRV